MVPKRKTMKATLMTMTTMMAGRVHGEAGNNPTTTLTVVMTMTLRMKDTPPRRKGRFPQVVGGEGEGEGEGEEHATRGRGECGSGLSGEERRGSIK